MAKVSNVIFCLNALNQDGSGASAHTILSAITPEYIPGLFSFSIVMILLDLEKDGEHILKIDFLNPRDENIATIESTLPSIENTSNLPNEFSGINLTLEWNNVDFKISGLHTLKIYYDNVEIENKDIFVKGRNE